MATLHTGQTVTLHMGQMGESVGLVHMSSMVAADHTSSSMLLDRIAECGGSAADVCQGRQQPTRATETRENNGDDNTQRLVHKALQKKRPQEGARDRFKAVPPSFPGMNELDGRQGYRSNPCRAVKL